ncbi:unnamed protein product, partial [Mesorhabditis belari]|uniref:EF-hand domain-containing protein n=1 Tax=Mesorhabditis belari TaxID=2138241 RepID=A0AAF3J587_9BILA
MATVELAPGVQTFETPKNKILKEDHKIDVNEISTHAKHVTPLLKPSSTKHSSLVQGSIPKETAIATHAAIYGLTPEKEKRLRELYDRLDMDNDGTIDIRDLTMALKHEMPHIPSRMAPLLMQKMAADSSNSSVDFGDFAKYVIDHEERLEKVFSDLDQNKDGYIDVQEIQIYCDTQGVPISDQRAADIVQQMAQTGNVNLQEFQDYMLLYPSSDPKEIAQFWRHNLIFDIGEDSQLPEDFTQEEIQSGVWWRHLVAGAVAGCMSRTSTAPLDRIKVYLQVHASRQNPLNLFSAIRLLYAEGGIRSFWRGNGINVVKIAPESAIKFMAYEQFKRWIQEYKGSNELTIYERLFAGSCAGVMSQTTIYPMEVLKTRLALRRTGQLDRGLIYFAHKLYRREGLIVFYKGYVPNLFGIIPYAGIDLAVYETMKNLYLKRNPEKKEPGTLALLACGTISSTCGQLASYPLALVRTRLQAREWIADPNQPDTMVGQFRYIIRNEGFTGLYRGLVPNFMKVIPAVGISYVVYENVRRHLGATMS